MTRTVEHHDHQIFDIPIQAPGNVLEVVRDRSVQIDGVLTGRAHHDFVHVAIGSIEQATAFGGREHRDGSRSAGGAKVGALQGIDGNVDFWNFSSVGKFGPHFLSNVKHGSFVAFAFANHNGAAHRDRVHGLAHRLGRDFITELALALPHRSGGSDCRHLDHAQEAAKPDRFRCFPRMCGLCLPDESA